MAQLNKKIATQYDSFVETKYCNKLKSMTSRECTAEINLQRRWRSDIICSKMFGTILPPLFFFLLEFQENFVRRFCHSRFAWWHSDKVTITKLSIFATNKLVPFIIIGLLIQNIGLFGNVLMYIWSRKASSKLAWEDTRMQYKSGVDRNLDNPQAIYRPCWLQAKLPDSLPGNSFSGWSSFQRSLYADSFPQQWSF